MKTRVLAAVFLLVISLVAASCQGTPEQEAISLNGFSITLYEPEVSFPDSIDFRIDAESEADIATIELHYEVDRLSPIPITSIAFPSFDTGTSVEAGWKWDMRKTGGLPPGTNVTYWWSIEDVQGNSAETAAADLTIGDKRFSWESVETDRVSLFWYHGSAGFAGELMEAAGESLDRLAADIGTVLEERASLYIYASAQSLREAMVYPQEWTGGVAYTEYSTIAIGISPTNLDWGKRAIAHELAHLVVHQFTYSGYGAQLPTWLDEGLAMYAEGGLTAEMEQVLESAVEQQQLYSLRSLSGTFPAQTQAAYLAYAQSYSVVKFMLDDMEGGKTDVIDLLNSFKQGNGYEDALDRVYGLDIDELDELWRQHVTSPPEYVSLSHTI